MGAGGEVHFLHRVFEVTVAFGAELAVLPDLAGAHGGVRRVRGFFETFKLDAAGGDDTSADGFGFLSAVGVGGQLAEIDERHLAVDVDPVQQGTGNPLPVGLYLAGRATALAFHVAVVAARASFRGDFTK
jgi:hypothetical protein